VVTENPLERIFPAIEKGVRLSNALKYVRLYSDESGESHFEDVDIPLAAVEFVPSAAALALSEPVAARQLAFLSGRAGWTSGWHPSSARNMFVVISGAWEVEASDGTVRRFKTGDVVLVEDTTGKGHRSRVTSNEPSLAALVQLPD
jgi:hypothetical protein